MQIRINFKIDPNNMNSMIANEIKNTLGGISTDNEMGLAASIRSTTIFTFHHEGKTVEIPFSSLQSISGVTNA